MVFIHSLNLIKISLFPDIGVPTILLLPSTTALFPVVFRFDLLISSMHPLGVHGTKISFSPRANFPAVIVVNPSTSFLSLISSVIFSPSIPLEESSGSWRMMPSTESSELSSLSLRTRSCSEMSLNYDVTISCQIWSF